MHESAFFPPDKAEGRRSSYSSPTVVKVPSHTQTNLSPVSSLVGFSAPQVVCVVVC
jgi:hypothetical protein